MIINTAIIEEGCSEIEGTLTNSEEWPELPRVSDGLYCECEVDKAGDDIAVTVSYRGAIELECARCLEHFARPVNGAVAVVLLPADSEHPAGSNDDHEVYYYSETVYELEVGAAVVDEVVLDVPLMPLCREECPGIIPHHKDAGRSDKSTPVSNDPRWDALKKLKRD